MAESYTVLARRYRSQSFDQLVGQEAIAQTLKNAISAGRVAHAFLFTGTRGVGKTSSARILAKALNCPNAKNGEPCNECETCKAITRGEDMDVIEIDGASNNSVDQIRELRQSAGIRPSHSPFKIYIIDEVHMLSTGAFNALLKTLEEPPSHVKFIFATTDVHKVPATIISRVQRFDFKNIPTPKIVEHLRGICQQENVQADEDALHRIARLGNGSMRDSLSILDRVLSLGQQHITDKLMEELLGKPPAAALTELVEAIAQSDASAALVRADALLSQGMGAEQVLGDLVDYLRNLMLVNICGADTELLDVPSDLKPIIAATAKKFDAPTIVHLIALCEQTLRSLKSSTMQRALFDALIVRLALSEQFSTIRELIDQNGAPQGQKKNDITGAAPAAPRPAENAGARPVAHAAPHAVASTPPSSAPASGRPAASVPAPQATHAPSSLAVAFGQVPAAPATPATPPASAPQHTPIAGFGRPSARPGPRSESATPVTSPSVAHTSSVSAAPTVSVPHSELKAETAIDPARSEAAAAQEDLATGVDPVGDGTQAGTPWDRMLNWLTENKCGSLRNMLEGKSSLTQLKGGQAILTVPENLLKFISAERYRVSLESAFASITGGPVRVSFIAAPVVHSPSAASGNGAQAHQFAAAPVVPVVKRVPPEIDQAVRDAAVIRRVIQKLGGDVASIELLNDDSEESS